MRRARFLVAASVALAVSGCAREAQHVEQVSPPANVPPVAHMYSSSPASAQQAYEQPPLPSSSQKASASNRGLLTLQSSTTDYVTRPTAQTFTPGRWYPTSANERKFLKQPPSATSEARSTPDSNRGLFRSRWAGIYAEQPAQETQAPVKRIESLPRVSAQADDQTGSVPPQSQPSSDNNRGLFAPRAAAPNLASQTSMSRPVPATSMYTSSRPAAPAYPAQPARQLAGTGGPYVASTNGYASAPAPAAIETAYTLDSGDKLRIGVFGQDGISNSYIVDASGKVNMPLIGAVQARGLTNQQLSEAVATRLKQGFVREPHVTVEIETYRPFFILGEVTTPGQYPYVVNMTAETAVAIAGGFAPRASKKTVELTRKSGGQRVHSEVSLDYPIRPGDTIVVKERWF